MPLYSIHKLPEEERPRERLLRHGAESLSTSELLAIILGSGTKGKSVLQLSQEIVTRFGSLRRLFEATVEELCQIKGLGLAKAIQLKAALTLGMKVSQQAISTKYRIENPLHAYNLIKDELAFEKREVFMVILQDVKGNVINHQVVAIGTLSHALVHPREVFYPAIRHKAASMILAHNHPSGDPTPSQEDHDITQTLVEAGKLVGIPIHDHLIVGDGRYVSLRQQGIIFS